MTIYISLSNIDYSASRRDILLPSEQEAMASSFFEDPDVQIGRLQTENRRLQTENCRLRTENDRLQSENRRLQKAESGSLEEEGEGSADRLRHESRRLHFENALLIKMENEAKKEVETLWRKEGATVDREKGKDEEQQADDRLRAENRRLRVQNVLLNRQKEADKAAEAFRSQLQIENAFLKKEKEGKEAQKADAIKDREEMCKALEMAMVQCESLRLELDRKKSELDEQFAQLVEARIARDKELQKVEDFMAYGKSMEERDQRAVKVVCCRARRMLERVKLIMDDNCDAGEAKAPENEEETDEKWIRVLMRPLEEEMEKIESSFSKKR